MRTLESIRADLRVNQEEMAKILGISYSSYQKKERGESPLLATELLKISELSGIVANEIKIPKR